ncbi:hypothetical protein J2Y88_004283 [Pseudomonas chlororaphis]|uniref:hypothetical protein n=1 Tax=Pseudomonas chlororaphis TaxID=587753 RepID=UPI00209C9B2A|nr:hypothetical protein [Pseudomonas chlororaphis]MCP1481972.1 hypothetical protein [Pseudomonas chlororaphis]MCP1597669.1 hypothetical protein [Pseudomonas chlororaphis]
MPRLSKGEIAPSIRGLSEAAARSAAARVAEFERLRDESPPSAAKLSVFLTVTSLAAWESVSLGITPLSSKTLRKYINELYEGGLSKLLDDAARSISETHKSKEAKVANGVKIWQLQAQQAVDSALDMTVRYLDLLERLKKLSLESEAAESELQRHYRRYEKHPHIKVVK